MIFRPPVPRNVRCAVCACAALLPLRSFGDPPAAKFNPNAVVAPAVPAARQATGTEPALSELPEANGLLHLAASLAAKADYPTSEIAYRQILNRPEFSLADKKSALLGLAHMYRKAGALTKAAAIYEKFVAQYPDDSRIPDAFLDLGRTLRDMGANELALNRFYSVINSTLKLPAQGFEHYTLLAKTAQFEIAQTYYEAGDYDQAGKFFSRVRLLDLAPADRARAHFMAGCAQENAGDLVGAVTTLRNYIEEWPNDENVPEARYMLATALGALNRTQDAMNVTLQLLRAEHKQSRGDSRRWSYWQRRAGNQLANTFFENGDIVNALTIYSYLAALSQDPAWRLPILYQVGLCYDRMFQAERARATYQEILDVAAGLPASPPPPAAIGELTQMAKWRMNQLGWRDDINHRLTTLLAPGVSTPAPDPGNPPPST
jgi:tetratricopeptide (TPR) repeat protein